MELVALPLLTAIIGGVMGGIVTHYFASRRDISTKRREIILTNLMEALAELDRSNSNRSDADLRPIERVVYKMHVFGDDDLIRLTRTFVDNFVSQGTADTTDLMLALRDKVRSELKLSPLKSGYQFLTVGSVGPGGENRPVEARWDEGFIKVTLADGRNISAPLWWYPKLAKASEEQRGKIELMPMGLHWPEIDEDISIASMLRGEKAPGAVAP